MKKIQFKQKNVYEKTLGVARLNKKNYENHIKVIIIINKNK